MDTNYLSSELRNLNFDTSLVAKDGKAIRASSGVSWSQCLVDQLSPCCGEFEIVACVFFCETLKCSRRSWVTFAKQRKFLCMVNDLKQIFKFYMKQFLQFKPTSYRVHESSLLAGSYFFSK